MNEFKHFSLQSWGSHPGMGLTGKAGRTGGVGTLLEHLFPLEAGQRAPRALQQGAGARDGVGT